MTLISPAVEDEVGVLLRHAGCLERAAADPAAAAGVAARLRAGATLMRSAARLAGAYIDNPEEAPRG